MKIKKGDNVIVISGKDKGKIGKVEKAYPKDNAALVLGVNMRKKHERAKKSGQKGQVIQKAHPIHISNVMIVDPKTNKPTRISRKKVGGKWLRITKKSDSIL